MRMRFDTAGKSEALFDLWNTIFTTGGRYPQMKYTESKWTVATGRLWGAFVWGRPAAVYGDAES